MVYLILTRCRLSLWVVLHYEVCTNSTLPGKYVFLHGDYITA